MFKLLVCTISIAFGLIGCASEIKRTPTELNEIPLGQYKRIIIFTEDIVVKLSSGYARKMKKGTQWQFVGSIKEGLVFKPTDNIFTVEGAHVREAYLTILDNRLIGFYIPGENSFSPLETSILLPIYTKDNS